MNILRSERIAVLAVASLMVASGLLQLVQPATMLSQMGVNSATPGEQQLMATVGLLLLVLGAALLQDVWRTGGQGPLLLWVAVEKAGFAALLASGLHAGVYTAAVWPLLVFDSAAVLLLLDYRRRQLASSAANGGL